LIFGKIITIVATRDQILRLKCTNSISARAPPQPQTPLGELYKAPQTTYMDLRGLLLTKERGGYGREGREERERGRNGREGKEREDGNVAFHHLLNPMTRSSGPEAEPRWRTRPKTPSATASNHK